MDNSVIVEDNSVVYPIPLSLELESISGSIAAISVLSFVLIH